MRDECDNGGQTAWSRWLAVVPAPIWAIAITQVIGAIWWGIHQDAEMVRLMERVTALEASENVDINSTRRTVALLEERQKAFSNRLSHQQTVLDFIVQSLGLRAPNAPPGPP